MASRIFHSRKSYQQPHPDWILTYGDTKYLDPGNKEVQAYVTNVIRDMLSRYDIDAIHFDDYFYPYRIGELNFRTMLHILNTAMNG